MGKRVSGDIGTFDRNWRVRGEAFYNHWTRDDPKNQVQLAFKNHWSLFNELMKSYDFNGGKRVLEVGCGRGSLSCYFSDTGFECTLLDLSASVIDIAKRMYFSNDLTAAFLVANVEALPFDENSFDVVFSVGLLEHLIQIELPMAEQVRVLDKGGLFIGYVVPKYLDNIQKDFEWVNNIIKGYAARLDSSGGEKEDVFRSDGGSEAYVPILQKLGLKDVHASGVYPLPMISHSIKFPFTLMPEESESAIVKHFAKMLDDNGKRTGKHPWLCQEGYGQAFIVWGYK